MASSGSYSGEAAGKAGKAEEAAIISHSGGIYPSTWEILAPYFAEYVGALVLTAAFLFNNTQLERSKVATGSFLLNSNGLMVGALVYAFLHNSGAHLNPSVTASLVLTGRLPTRRAFGLVLCQLCGAATAAILVFLCCPKVAAVELGPRDGHTWRAVVATEVLYTAMLCFVYLNCVASVENNPLLKQNGFGGLAVGLVFIAAAFAMRDICPAVLNSAIALGLGVADNLNLSGRPFNGEGLVYFFSDMTGAVIGTGLFRVVRPDEMHTSAGTAAKPVAVGTFVAAEFIGTFFIILTKSMNRLALLKVDQAVIGPESWAVMAAIASMTYALHDVSGAYFNPALTLAAAACRRASLPRNAWIFYPVAQVLGAVVASVAFASMSFGRKIPAAPNRFSAPLELWSEALFSAFTCYVVLSCRFPQGSKSMPLRQNSFHGLAYGACHVAAGFAIGPITGAMLNPTVVVSFVGVDLFHGHLDSGMLLFIFYQLAGGLFGAGLFAILHAELYRSDHNQHPKKSALRPEPDLASV